MALTITDLINIVSDTDPKKRVRHLLVKFCLAIPGGLSNARLNYAVLVVNNPDAYVDRFMIGIATAIDLATVTTAAQITDAVITAAINSIYDRYAGA